MKKIMICLCLLMLASCTQNKDQLEPIQTEMTIECGDVLNLNPIHFIKTSISVSKIDVHFYKNNTEIDVKEEKDYEITAVGEYELKFGIEDEIETVHIHVVDTTSPTIDYNGTQKTFFIGEEIVDINANISCSDYSKTTMNIEGKVDFNTPGDYSITVTAEDEYGNQSTKVFEFNVMYIEDAVEIRGTVEE